MAGLGGDGDGGGGGRGKGRGRGGGRGEGRGQGRGGGRLSGQGDDAHWSQGYGDRRATCREGDRLWTDRGRGGGRGHGGGRGSWQGDDGRWSDYGDQRIAYREGDRLWTGRERGESWRARVELEGDDDRWDDDDWQSTGAMHGGDRGDRQWRSMRTESEAGWNEGHSARRLAGWSMMEVGSGRGYKRKTNMETEANNQWQEHTRGGPSVEPEGHDQRVEQEDTG